MISASIAGASGYTGGELLRLLLAHPEVEVAQVTSERSAGSFVHFTHPNLRGSTKLKFVAIDELVPCDVLFLGLPHGSAMESIDRFAGAGAAHRRSLRRLPAARSRALREVVRREAQGARRGSIASSTACPSSSASGCARPPT